MERTPKEIAIIAENTEAFMEILIEAGVTHSFAVEEGYKFARMHFEDPLKSFQSMIKPAMIVNDIALRMKAHGTTTRTAEAHKPVGSPAIREAKETQAIGPAD